MTFISSRTPATPVVKAPQGPPTLPKQGQMGPKGEKALQFGFRAPECYFMPHEDVLNLIPYSNGEKLELCGRPVLSRQLYC